MRGKTHVFFVFASQNLSKNFSEKCKKIHYILVRPIFCISPLLPMKMRNFKELLID